jgi:4-hydroxy-3-methylbut-2-enyl diphosphate reductase
VAKGLVISALSTKLFIPASQTGVAKDGDISALLGTTQSVKITELGTGKRAVASISVVNREKRNAEIEEFWSTLAEGQVFEGTVKSMTDYGVFVNIGPVDGMVHKSELSWKRFRIPSDIVAIGDKLTVYIKDLNPEKKRISLGCKTSENNPWNVFMSKYNKDDVVSVKIASIMTYGAFAEIVDGVDGLIHISQIALKRLGNPAEVLHVGDVVDAKIIEIDEENKKVSLSIRALLENTEAEEEAPAEEAPATDAE